MCALDEVNNQHIKFYYNNFRNDKFRQLAVPKFPSHGQTDRLNSKILLEKSLLKKYSNDVSLRTVDTIVLA